MKRFIKYMAALLVGVVGLTSCQDDVDAPALVVPEASMTPNATIAQVKQLYYQSATNYIDTIGQFDDEMVAKYNERHNISNPAGGLNYDGVKAIFPNYDALKGQHIIVKGRVCSSDKDGNVFRKIVIQDGTAALPISIYSYNNYLEYRMGQEVVIDLTDMFIGAYSGSIQLGWPSKYLDGWQASFLPPAFLREHIELNGLPDLAKVDTLQINSFSQLGNNESDMIRLVGRLVQLNNVKFETPGVTLSTYHETVNLNLIDSENNTGNVVVRTSGYSSFWNQVAPSDNCDVAGILDYYISGSTGTWQLILIDDKGIRNIGTPTLPPGGRDNPYTVGQVAEMEEMGMTGNGWVMGYIVGTVAPGIDADVPVTSNDDIEWGAEATLNNSLVIAPDPSIREWTACLVVELPQGSKLRQYGNLRDNPANLGRQIFIRGSFNKVWGMAGITGNRGTVNEFEIVGLEIPEEISADFNSFNGGDPKSSYGTYTNATGWTLTNGCVLGGTSDGTDVNPRFAFIGTAETLAPTLNGKVSAPGKLTSPVLTGGIRTLTFNYGFAFSDQECQFTVNILQGGSVVKSDTVNLTTINQKEVYTYTLDCNVSGDFSIEIVNDCKSQATGNRERVSIWNLAWTK